MADNLQHFLVEREAGGFTRQIALLATSEKDAVKTAASLHAHQKRVRATYRVECAPPPQSRPSGYGR